VRDSSENPLLTRCKKGTGKIVTDSPTGAFAEGTPKKLKQNGFEIREGKNDCWQILFGW
jgi:hypothetical protein